METKRTKLLITATIFMLILSCVTFLDILIYFIRFPTKHTVILIPIEEQTGFFCL